MNAVDDVAQAEQEGFEPLASIDELPPRVRAESMFWARLLFAHGKSPYGPVSHVERRVHRASASAPDLLRHEYDAGDGRLAVTEGRAFVLVTIPRASLDVLCSNERDRQSCIAAKVSALLGAAEFPAGLDFVFPEQVHEGSSFSTDPSRDPRLICTWNERVDGGIRGGELYVVIYKRLPQLVGWLDPYSWLSPNSRIERSPGFPRRILRRKK